MISLGEKIELIRKNKGISLAELANKAKISYAQLLSIKNGKCKPHPITLMKLANALGCSYDELNLFA